MSNRPDLIDVMRSTAKDCDDIGKSAHADLGQIMRDGADEIARLKDKFREFAEIIADGNAGKILAIIAYRTATGASVLESKNWVEARSPFPSINTTRH